MERAKRCSPLQEIKASKKEKLEEEEEEEVESAFSPSSSFPPMPEAGVTSEKLRKRAWQSVMPASSSSESLVDAERGVRGEDGR